MIRAAVALFGLWLPTAVLAFEPTLPQGASQAIDSRETGVDYELPVAPYRDGAVEILPISGDLTRSVWHLPAIATKDLLRDVMDQLIAQGYAPLFECDTRKCGGFDFRFAIDVADAPEMRVNLGDFRFAAALDTNGRAVAFLASAHSGETHLQIDHIIPAAQGIAQANIARALESAGRVVLDYTPTPASEAPQPSPVLAELAQYMADNPSRRIAIVVHSGSGNDDDVARAAGLNLAQSVRAQLVAEYRIDPGRLEALWLGPFMPRATPLTETGRALNSRVEAVVLPQ